MTRIIASVYRVHFGDLLSNYGMDCGVTLECMSDVRILMRGCLFRPF
jgi:hypothetical protein